MNNYGKYFEEFSVGDKIDHALTKTILESDNNLFCLLTMNHHPVHIDEEYCKKQQHGRILVVGTLVFSLIVGISVADISGKAIANLDYESIQHKNPVFIGDTLRAESEILHMKESMTKKDRGIIYVETRAYNQKNQLVLIFRRNVLIKKRMGTNDK
ncbi:MaoC family dehydratase [Alkaliphilus peptidifermentans]|uniref:Acyl dehydratase n=1 Tax=Alkaliphilus peptidifermentans DSM 18978 TaxID=1120976 RepID=A0A1G5JEF1_9FIRM|nr:MaoC family dehydratase [Alkaliphilus peptidifermentans]SCY86732.1 Acyl dehydratase [Alkaliphilus peptidifermentans DSM 18978]